jgi:methyl-CpG-binding domain protein 4
MRTPLETSPYDLLQERFRHDPWKLLVVCMMLNQTSAVQVKAVMGAFFEKYPDAAAASNAAQEEMAEIIRPLGLYRRRSNAIIRMSRDYNAASSIHGSLVDDWLEVQDFYGVGKYAADSYRMFVMGEIVDDAEDKELKRYVEWARRTTP